MDKFLYSGLIALIAVTDSQGTTGTIRHLGVGLETEVDAWEIGGGDIEVIGGQLVRSKRKEYVSDARREMLQTLGFLNSCTMRRVGTTGYVSDHYGIVSKFRIG